MMNKKIDTLRPELYPIPVKSPWYHIGMDFVGPISPQETDIYSRSLTTSQSLLGQKLYRLRRRDLLLTLSMR